MARSLDRMTVARIAGWFLLYFALVIVLLTPLSLQLDTHMPDDGDSILGMWILWWGATHLSLGYPEILDANTYYPHDGALAYTEPLLGQGLLSWPLFRFQDNRVLATNLAMVLTLALTALGGHLLFRELTESDAAAFVGSMYYAFGSYNLSQIPRLQLVSLQWMPLALLCLHRFFVRDQKRYLPGFVIFSVLHGLSCFYYLSFYGIVLAIVVPVYFFSWKTYTNKIATLSLAVSGLAFGGFFLWVAQPFFALYARYEFAASPINFDLVRYFYPPAENVLYGAFARPRLVDHFLGFVAVAVAIVGAWRWVRARGANEFRWIAWAFVVLGVLGLLLSGGPDIVFNRTRIGPGPFRLLAQFGPFENLRDPSRMAIFPRLAMSVFIAYAAASLFGARRRIVRIVGMSALAFVLLLEQHSPRYGRGDPFPVRNIPEVYTWLGANDMGGAVAELPPLPFRFVRFNTMEAYFSSFHENPILFNKPSFYPPATELLRWELRHFPDRTSLTLLRALGVKAAVVHPKRWTDPRRRRRLLRRLGRRSEQLPHVKTFPDSQDDELWERYQLGGEQLHSVRPLDEEGSARECDCELVARTDYEVRSRRGNPSLATDGDRQTRWTTHRGQLMGDYLDIVFERPRRVARIEIEMSFPWEEFPRNLELIGTLGEDRFSVALVEDAWYKVALVRQLVDDPTKARLRYDVEATDVDILRLRISHTESGAQPWSVAEIHVYESEAH